MALTCTVKKFSIATTLQAWLTANAASITGIDAIFQHKGIVLVYH